MVRNVDSPFKFLMYSRFLQVLINNQVADLSSHTTKYTSPALTQKVFANMRRIGKGFSGLKTPLFATMLVQPQAAAKEEDEEDEVPAAPTPPSLHMNLHPLHMNLHQLHMNLLLHLHKLNLLHHHHHHKNNQQQPLHMI
uniref:Uncharacterized protein n=1 Tax=Tanacetum cinerariifolium TaxID=118510 RepID=A0A699RN71_TANCI|nr:hypothetical protein [Tanacetum cinerariifolium]